MKYTMKRSTLIRTGLLVSTLLGSSGGIGLLPTSAQNKMKRASMMDESPFDLHLKVADHLQLQAVLRNRSRVDQAFLYDVHLQPVELVLLDATGKPVPNFDSRSTMKFNNTVYRAMYHKLAAGKEEALQTEYITVKDNSYTLQWSPYRFEHIAPGTYKAHLVWKSNLDRWKDSETSKSGNIKDIWKGTVESKPVIIKIPGAS